jgi:hypothetical protein
MLTAVALGFVLGLRHAFDPDHVIAVSAIAARHRSPWTASWVGVSWGVGHSATVLLSGALLIALRVAVPGGLARSLELGVGILLVVLGVVNLIAAAESAPDGHGPPDADGTPLRTSLTRSGLVGLAHGLAGSGAVALLATAAMPTPAAALVYLVVFGLGSIAGMVAFSLVLGAPFAALGEVGRWRRPLTAGTGLLSLGFGAWLVLQVGITEGLLT